MKEIYKGKNGIIRRADVRTNTGVLMRPVPEIAVLGLDSKSWPINGSGNVD